MSRMDSLKRDLARLERAVKEKNPERRQTPAQKATLKAAAYTYERHQRERAAAEAEASAPVQFRGYWPDELRTALAALVEDLRWLVPAATAELWIFLDADDADCSTAECTTIDEYGVAKIRIGADWVTATPSQRREIVIHELLHITVNALVDVVNDAIEIVKETEPKLAAHLDKQMRRAMERATSDLCRIVNRRLGALEASE